jgi:sporulation protein YlmC with PRC-barrel domain
MTSKLTIAVSAFGFLLGAGVAPLAAQEAADPALEESEGSYEATESTEASADIVGKAVFDANGQEVGTIDEVLVGEDGTEQAVISVGGFLGLGAKKISVPASDLQPSEDGSALMISMTAEEIEAAPAFEAEAETETEGAIN